MKAWFDCRDLLPSLGWMLLSGLVLVGCETIKPYEKELLLDPIMADERTQGLMPSFMGVASGRFEKLGGGSGSAAGTSCPTCGG